MFLNKVNTLFSMNTKMFDKTGEEERKEKNEKKNSNVMLSEYVI